MLQRSRHTPFARMLVTIVVVLCSLAAAMAADRSTKAARVALASCVVPSGQGSIAAVVAGLIQ